MALWQASDDKIDALHGRVQTLLPAQEDNLHAAHQIKRYIESIFKNLMLS